MSESNTSMKKDFEELVNKTIEANQFFIKESGNLFQQVVGNKGAPTNTSFLQNDFFSKALNAYASLHMQHVKNMIDLGISLTKNLTPSPGTNSFEEKNNNTETGNKPSFILMGEAKAGERVSLQFVMDNNKQAPVACELVNSSFISQSNFLKNDTFIIFYTPAIFAMEPGASQPVEIVVISDANTAAGLYISHVQVKGFEPAFFSIHINII